MCYQSWGQDAPTSDEESEDNESEAKVKAKIEDTRADNTDGATKATKEAEATLAEEIEAFRDTSDEEFEVTWNVPTWQPEQRQEQTCARSPHKEQGEPHHDDDRSAAHTCSLC